MEQIQTVQSLGCDNEVLWPCITDQYSSQNCCKSLGRTKVTCGVVREVGCILELRFSMHYKLKELKGRGEFVPLKSERLAVERIAELGGKFRITPNNRVWSVSVTHKFEDRHVEVLFEFRHLNSFSFNCSAQHSSNFTDLGLSQLSRLESLKGVFASTNGALTDKALKAIAKKPRLLSLKLPESGVTTGGLFLLHSHSTLRQLSLNGCAIDDRCVETLSTLRALRYLWLERTFVTSKAINAIKIHLPKCCIVSS